MNCPSSHCRLARLSDILFIRATVQASWQTFFSQFLSPQQLAYDLEREYGTSVIEAHVNHGPQTFWIVEDTSTQEPKGFVATEKSTVEGISTVTIHKLYFHPSCTGQGWGAGTMAWLKAAALSNGASQLALLVNRHNKAKCFYERHGFTVVGEVDTQIGEGPDGEPYWRNDYRMTCAL